ncbi:MAG: hypothetical protein ACI8V4_000555 [Ilumatobacter sp.]
MRNVRCTVLAASLFDLLCGIAMLEITRVLRSGEP